jgi:hypothetical protein
MRLILEVAMTVPFIALLFFVFCIELIIIFWLCLIGTKEARKMVRTDLLLGIMFIVTTVFIFRHQLMESDNFGLSGEGGMILLVAIPHYLIVNGLFLWRQVYLSRSTNQKKLKIKNRCFIIHILALFSFHFLFAILDEFVWVLYYLFFAIVSYLFYGFLYCTLIGYNNRIIKKVYDDLKILFNEVQK